MYNHKCHLKKPSFDSICNTAILLSSLPKRSLHGKLCLEFKQKKVHDEHGISAFGELIDPNG